MNHSLQSMIFRVKPVGTLLAREFSLSCNRLVTQPLQLLQSDIGKMFLVDPQTVEILDFKNVLPKNYSEQIKSLRECAFLCREETLKVYNCLGEISSHAPSSPLRMVLWGKPGTGKTITLNQLIYFAHSHDFVLVTVPNTFRLTRPSKKELKKRPDLKSQRFIFKSSNHIDTPAFAQLMLEAFKKQNQTRWNQLTTLKTTKTYHWNEIESTKEGQPITDMIELGLSAPYLATECVGGLFRELRHYASSGVIKMLVTIDIANALFGKCTLMRPDHTEAVVDDLTLVRELKKFLEPTWSNGLCALVADAQEQLDRFDTVTISIDTPRDLFGDDGFEKITPFIPIETKLYTEEEAKVIHNYYCEKMWLTSEAARSNEGRKQMYYLSAYNPHFYERLCAFN